jgi:putative oxidoreductase
MGGWRQNPLVILLELGGGLAIVLGWLTRPLSLLLAGFTVVAAALFHHNFGDQVQIVMFMKNLPIAAGFLALTASGAGAGWFDAWWARDR